MPTEPLQTTRIKSVSDLGPICEAWRELAAGAPMRSPEWLLGWWESYAAPDDELWILALHEPNGALVGLAPLCLQGVGSSATIRILGMAEAFTHHPAWLCAAGWERRVGIAVARFLLKHRSSWRRLYFESIDADAAAIHATVDYLVENGCLCHRRQINSCWKIALPSTWDDYLRLLSGSLRKRCRKLQRQFFDTGKVRLRQVESEADLREGFEVLLHLHAARWGSSKKPLGVFDDQRFRTFHEKVSREMLALRQLRMAWLECEGQPIAVEYQFFDAKAVYAYQAGVDLSMDEYSPGKLSMMAAIQFAIAHGCESFDLLRGDEPYKANWRATPSACHDHRLWHDGVLGRAEWGMWSAYTLAVRRLTPLLPSSFVSRGLKLFHWVREAGGSLCRGGR